MKASIARTVTKAVSIDWKSLSLQRSPMTFLSDQFVALIGPEIATLSADQLADLDTLGAINITIQIMPLDTKREAP